MTYKQYEAGAHLTVYNATKEQLIEIYNDLKFKYNRLYSERENLNKEIYTICEKYGHMLMILKEIGILDDVNKKLEAKK